MAASHNFLVFSLQSLNPFQYKAELDMKVNCSGLAGRKPKDCGYAEYFSFKRPLVQSVVHRH